MAAIPRIDLITMLLAGGLVAVIAAWWWQQSGAPKDKPPRRLGLRRRSMFICATSLLLGLLILAGAEWSKGKPWEDTLRDVGRAFLAAGIIGYIVELAEIRNFFETLITDLVTGMEFLGLLTTEKLLSHGKSSITEMVGRSINNREYAKSLIEPIFDSLLPQLGRVYRESFNTVIKLHVISRKEELAAALKEIWNEEIGVEELCGTVCMMEVRYTFWLLRPDKLREPFKGSVLVESTVIEGVPLNRHARCTVQIGDGRPSERPLRAEQHGFLHHFTGEYEVPLDEPRVAVEVRTWQLDASRASFSLEMISLTRGLTVMFSCKQDIYPTLAVFGLNGGESNVKSDDPNVATYVQPDLILLPGHGFSVSWSPGGETPRRARLASPGAAAPVAGQAPAAVAVVDSPAV